MIFTRGISSLDESATRRFRPRNVMDDERDTMLGKDGMKTL